MFEVVTFCGFNVDLIKFNSIVKILTFLFEVGSSNPSHLLAPDILISNLYYIWDW